MTKTAAIEPKVSKTSKFRVAIAHPPNWKIKAIADYKKQLILKEKIAAVVSSSLANSTLKNNTDGTTSSSVPEPVKRKEIHVKDRSLSFDKGVAMNEKAELTFVKPKVPSEQINKELDNLSTNSVAIRNKLQTLCSVKYSLLWLLRKANLTEKEIFATANRS